MSSREQVIPVEQLLEAARQRVVEISLRRAAAEIGIEHSSLNKLLGENRSPRAKTITLLTTWYLRRTAESDLGPSRELVDAALALIVAPFPPDHRGSVAEEIRIQLRAAATRLRIPIPPGF